MSIEKEIQELSLLLLYLTSWKEDEGFGELHRSWKGYPFEALDQLKEGGYLHHTSNQSKSVYLTKTGIEEAEVLMQKYLNVNKKGKNYDE